MKSALGKQWKLKCTQKTGNVFERLLSAREVKSPEEFFEPGQLEKLGDPFAFEDMQKAVTRLERAISKEERITVYGDYDVDGTSGAALLILLLERLGAKVSYRIPHRLTEGYGLHSHYIEELAEQGVKVLITVDCGISCVKETALATEKGIDVIITDHHTVPEIPPEAFATLHPQLSSYPFKELSGSGVAFKLACGLLHHLGYPEWIPEFTDLAMLGTIADCVPLYGENRYLVKLGLRQLAQTQWEGLRYLVQPLLGYSRTLSSTLIAFQVAPRLNAAGRMDHPYWGLQTLISKGEKARQKAAYLDELNQKRRERTQAIQKEVEAHLDFSAPLLIAHGSSWSSGLVGLVAGKIQEKYGKPVFLLEDRGEELVGSARSLPGFHLVEALNQVADLLEGYGGHEQAAGFHLKKKNLEAFYEGLLSYAEKTVPQKAPEQELLVDTLLHPEEWNQDTLERLALFEPFGMGNPVPLFLLDRVHLQNFRKVGADRRHLKFTGQFGSLPFSGIGFDFAAYEDQLKEAKALVGRLSGLELELVDFF